MPSVITTRLCYIPLPAGQDWLHLSRCSQDGMTSCGPSCTLGLIGQVRARLRRIGAAVFRSDVPLGGEATQVARRGGQDRCSVRAVAQQGDGSRKISSRGGALTPAGTHHLRGLQLDDLLRGDPVRLTDEVHACPGAEHLQRLGQGRLGQAIGGIPSGAYLAVHTKDRADGLTGFTGTPLPRLRPGPGTPDG